MVTAHFSSVELVLSLLAQGIAQEDILDDYPDLEPDDVRAGIAGAHAVISATRWPPCSATWAMTKLGKRQRRGVVDKDGGSTYHRSNLLAGVVVA